jgi:NOL1/NOP2/fmu family ribosome biogenesis protein
MMKIKPLNKKEASKILDQIKNEYGCNPPPLDFMIDKYTFYISEKNKIYIINNSIKQVNLERIRINSLGLYFCELNNDAIRLSLEGSHIIGPTASKNLLELDSVATLAWLRGEDIESSEEFCGFVILKNNKDFLGCGRYKEGRILNYIPKNRRIRSTS